MSEFVFGDTCIRIYDDGTECMYVFLRDVSDDTSECCTFINNAVFPHDKILLRDLRQFFHFRQTNVVVHKVIKMER
jgi:hypothetical protein